MEPEPQFDSAGVPRAPCSGQLMGAETCVCGHNPALHDDQLVCRVCHEVCGYCGQFRDQHEVCGYCGQFRDHHNWHEWESCQAEIEHAQQQADALAWWRSQQ